MDVYGIQKHLLESDGRLLSLGLYPFEGEFINYKRIHGFERLGWDQYPDLYGAVKMFIVTLETDAVNEVRQIYTIWDVLGDIGGLADMLELLGWPIITFTHAILGSGISRAFLQSLFKVQGKTESTDVCSHIKERSQLRVKLCSWLTDRRARVRMDKAQSLIDYELDILQFLRNQFAIKAM